MRVRPSPPPGVRLKNVHEQSYRASIEVCACHVCSECAKMLSERRSALQEAFHQHILKRPELICGQPYIFLLAADHRPLTEE